VFEIGNSLREARLRRGIDFAQAELATKIRGKYLRALEDEQFELLPAETYVKGFLRTYAEYLGLDGQLYVDEFNSRFVAGEERELRPRRSTARPKRGRRFETNVVLIALAAIAVITVIVISAWKSSGGGSPSSTPPSKRAVSHVRHGSIPLLTVIPLRGATHVTARKGGASGDVAFDGTIQKGDAPVAIRGTRLWVQISTPENLRVIVHGHTQRIPGAAPRVIVVTAKGWRPA
jgi:cytoskeletal protein RodZ